jgi:hypothetical protein
MTALPLTRDQEDAANPLKKGPAQRLAKGWTPNSGETAVRFQLRVSAVDTHSASPPPNPWTGTNTGMGGPFTASAKAR